MCGRYTLFTPVEELESRFGVTFGEGFEPSYNCAPGEDLPVVTAEDPDRATQMTWGLTPSWAEEPFELINARAETIRGKRSFADAYESRRCLVPADGFYEWVDAGDGSGKRPYRVAFEDDRPFAMAGLYERWTPPKPETTQTDLGAFGRGTDANERENGDGDRTRETFAVVTTEPNDLVADLHHRMAVILAPDEEERWLHGDPEEAAAMMDPYPAAGMEAYPVSTRVNAAGTDGADLIEPIGVE
ncbi:SOS response-associated peptidase [Halorubrum sp. 48-1-W]|uniref:SOS response-associated peptidase n=1 Tax=Halorubrum sp. 48-1-W TaxID=2249761 RepID=UPI000DCE65CF|nr:SOS response-associated peptidase [Halorubrum sp. 48-1-W]RAW46189.1 SOS response-associated peptidase [Halorubrum sp. 48-1-W]